MDEATRRSFVGRGWRVLLLLFLPLIGAGPSPAGAAVSPDSSSMDWSRVPEYRIVPGDLLYLNFGQPDPNVVRETRNTRVRPDGRISVFPIGDVVAAGRTVRELEAALVSLLSAELRNPRVTVEVQQLAGNQVHVLGRVGRPGSYDIGPFTTLIQALSNAGGFSDDAARNSVVVFRRDGANTVRVHRVRVDQALKSGRLDADLVLSRFDIVYVPRSTIGNINVFSRQFFGEQISALHFALLGWELFRAERIVISR
jgi:polysaccharide export outer membrane protein